MKLYIWKPKGYGELSYFVVANSESEARVLVKQEILRRIKLPADDYDNKLSVEQYKLFDTDYYELSIADVCEVVTHSND